MSSAIHLCAERALYENLDVEDIEGFFGKYEAGWGKNSKEWLRRDGASGKQTGYRTEGISHEDFYKLQEYAFLHWLRNPYYVRNHPDFLVETIERVREGRFDRNEISILILRFYRPVFVGAGGGVWRWGQFRSNRSCLVANVFATQGQGDLRNFPIAECKVHRSNRAAEQKVLFYTRLAMTPIRVIVAKGTTLLVTLPWSPQSLLVLHKTPTKVKDLGHSYIAERFANEDTLRKYFNMSIDMGETAFVFREGGEDWYFSPEPPRLEHGSNTVEMRVFGDRDLSESEQEVVRSEIAAVVNVLSTPVLTRGAPNRSVDRLKRERYLQEVSFIEPQSDMTEYRRQMARK